ncbi:MAG: hypothetical protein V1871_03265 [Planctomycetota bacterium]
MKLSLAINILNYLLAIIILSSLFIWGQTVENPLESNDVKPIESVISPTIPITNNTPVIIKRFEGLLDDVKDKTAIEQDMAYNTLLQYVSRLSTDEISNKVKQEITYNALTTTPDKFRGEFIRCRGVLLYLNPYSLKTNPAGVDIYYAGMIANPTNNEFYRFHTIDKPEQLFKSLDENRSFADEVEVEGAFLKIAEYEVDPKFGEGYRYAPFIIGKKITRIIHPPPKAAQTFQWLIAIIVGIVLVLLFFYVIISTRKEKKETMTLFAKSKSPSPDTSKKDTTNKQ